MAMKKLLCVYVLANLLAFVCKGQQRGLSGSRKALRITRMSTEDIGRGRIVRKCEIIPKPEYYEEWLYTWTDSNGRVMSNNEILSISVNRATSLGRYTCEARNPREGNLLRGEFSLRSSQNGGTKSYRTEIEELTRTLEFNKPYMARCFVQPRPPYPLEFVWYHKNRIVSRGEQLVIPAFNSQSAGHYICTVKSSRSYLATDSAVFANATLSLRIRGLDGSDAGTESPAQRSLQITPPILRIRPGQDGTIECHLKGVNGRESGPPPNLRSFDYRLKMRVQPVGQLGVQATITDIDVSKNGTTIQCYSSDPTLSPVEAVIIVEEACQTGYRRCRNGVCIEAGLFCNGRLDCSDGSDEEKDFCAECDPIVKTCEELGGRAPIKNTYMFHWQCDGEDDCGNGYDEASCFDSGAVSCLGKTFTCSTSQKQIPASFVCDKDMDCHSGDDEENCADPRVVDTPAPKYTFSHGETAVLRCEVTGYPSPRVLWRFNWHCLPDKENRFVVQNTLQGCGTPRESVVSTLTINNFQPGDDGQYNCEGVSGLKRTLSKDYNVIIGG